jgi:hypothetical protein
LLRNAITLLALILSMNAASTLLSSAAWGSYMLPPQGTRAKDFTIVKHDGLYHLFYTRRNTSAPAESTENDLGHAVSADLFGWTHLAPKLPVRPGKWDNRHIWAPHVIESGGVFYMFYTGVTHVPGSFTEHQRIGVATSTDLLNWNRLDAPVLSCDDVPWAYCDPLSPVTAFRDPFVLADPSAPGEYWMFYSTSLDSDPTSMISGIAGSADLGGTWGNVGALDVTNDMVTFSELSESSHLFEHDGLYYLVWTTNKAQPIAWATSEHPIAQLPSWTYRGTLSSMLGFDTSPWFASEHFRDGLIDYFAAASLTAIEILRIEWTAPPNFQVVQPSNFHIRGMAWSKPTVAVGDTATLTLHGVGWFSKSAKIEALEVDAGGVMTPIPNAAIGLPDSIPMYANQTVFTWTATTYPDPDDGEDGPEILVRMTDQTAQAPVIRVAPPPPPPPSGGNSDLAEDTSEGLVRFMRRSPLGMAFRVDMPAEGPARLDLFDVTGRRLATVHDGPLGRGTNVIRVGRNLSNWTPGVYFARLETRDVERDPRESCE